MLNASLKSINRKAKAISQMALILLNVFSSAIRFNLGCDDENENSQITIFLVQHLQITNAKTNQYNGRQRNRMHLK